MKYVLGLDIGITSVGWAVLDLDGKRIAGLGVRAFNAAEDPKTHAPLAEPRRLARSARRRIRRRAGRMKRAKDLFVRFGLIEEEQRESAFLTADNKPDPWQLRAEGLDRLLSGEEFARALFHIVKRRGFKSNRKKVAEQDKDSQKMLGSISGNRALMAEENYRTAGEMFWRDPRFADRKRNAPDSYENTVDRAMLEDEIKTLFACQRGLGSRFAGEEFERAVLDVFSWQKPFASGDQILKLVGKCTFEHDEIRAPRHSYHAERFNLLSKLNSLSYSTNGDTFRLTPEQREAVCRMAYDKAKVTYAQIRKELALPEAARFAGLQYTHRNKETRALEESSDCEKSTFFEMKGYHAIRKACETAGVWDKVKGSPDLMDDLAFALTFYKTDEDIRSYLSGKSVPEPVIDAALTCEPFTKVLHLSTKALKNIIPHLEGGKVYSDACAAAGYDHSNVRSGQRGDKLPVVGDEVTNNPVVRRALSQARKVVNAVITRYGAPYRIHIELARDLGKGPEERAKIKRRQEESRAEAERRKAEFVEKFKREPRGADVLAYRLYSEQGGKCAYSLKPIDVDRLFEPGYVQIDHILPYSRSFDDSMSNKVLCLASENQKKRDRTPYEAFGHDQKWWAEYEKQVAALFRDHKKRQNLLRKEFDQRQEDEWKERSLSDTRWIAREFSLFVRENLKFADPEVKKPVRCVSGFVTSRVRGLWGLEKNREEDDLHHAMDAAVVASITDWQIQAITNHAKAQETYRSIDETTGEIIDRAPEKRPYLPMPWPNFRKELLARLSENPAEALRSIGIEEPGAQPILVSRMPIRKASGPIHEETMRSAKRLESDRISAVRKPLTSLSRADLDNLFAPETNERLYAAIRTRMEQFDYDAKKAFAEPLYKPTNDGSPGPVVRSVKVCQPQYTGVKVRGGIADNGGMVRTDVFTKGGKYYLVPVYVSDVIAGKLPDRAIAAHKPEEEWPVVDESYKFLFSLQPYDFIGIQTGTQDFIGYYRGTHRNKGALTVCMPNNSATTWDIGARTAFSIRKFHMGVLGDYHPVRKEVRRGLENRRSLQPGKAENKE